MKTENKAAKIENKYHVVLLFVLIVMFFAGIILSVVSMSLYNNNINDYYHTQSEYKSYSPVSSVAYDENSQLVYVFYEQSNVVNVYNHDGDFQWSVSVPRQAKDTPQFYLDGDKMYMIWGSTYVYNAESGEFLDIHVSTKTELAKAYDFEKNYSLEGTDVDFNETDVYVTNGSGKDHYIVNRPAHYALINPFVGFLVSIISLMLSAIIASIKLVKTAKEREYDIQKCSKRIKGLALWFKFLIVVNVLYAVANIACLLFTPVSLMAYIIPLAVLFGISSVVYIIVIRARKNEDEKHYLALWFVRSLVALITAFFSVVISTVVLG